METVVVAVRTLVEEFTRYSRQDLWEEFMAAEIYDRGIGIGLPEEYGFSAWDPVRGREALSDLIKRSVAVLANQSDYSQYTIKFATHCDEHFHPPKSSTTTNLDGGASLCFEGLSVAE